MYKCRLHERLQFSINTDFLFIMNHYFRCSVGCRLQSLNSTFLKVLQDNNFPLQVVVEMSDSYVLEEREI